MPTRNSLNVDARVLVWGNGLGLRITKSVADVAQLEANAQVSIAAELGRIVIEVKTKKLTLDDLLDGFDPKRHSGEVMAFQPIGKESL